MNKEIEIETPHDHDDVQVVMPAYEDLLLVGDIDEQLYTMFLDQFLKAEAFTEEGPIKVKLTSGGGQMGIGFAIYDLIKGCSFPTRIEVYGYACSAAAVILQSASERCMSKNSRIMFHNVSFMADQPIHLSGDELTYHTNEMKNSTTNLIKIVSKRSGIPIKEVKKFCEEEKFFSANEALKIGLIDKIL
jgi:ATP-dependent protease ClpP protease subunit